MTWELVSTCCRLTKEAGASVLTASMVVRCNPSTTAGRPAVPLYDVRGRPHWLFGFGEEQHFTVLNLNMRTGDMSLEKFPFLGRNHLRNTPCLTLSVNGALSLLWMQTQGNKLHIWEQQPDKDGGLKWVYTKTIEYKELGKRTKEERQLCILGEKCGTLLVSHRYLGVCTADLETGMVEQVVDWPHGGNISPWDTVPMEVDWPGIFSSRLDTRYS